MIDGLIVTIQKLYGTNLVRLFLYINAVFRKKLHTSINWTRILVKKVRSGRSLVSCYSTNANRNQTTT